MSEEPMPGWRDGAARQRDSVTVKRDVEVTGDDGRFYRLAQEGTTVRITQHGRFRLEAPAVEIADLRRALAVLDS